VIRTETADGVRTITFARPERRNAMDLAMFRAYYDALADAEATHGVRAIVVTGQGGSFCAGAEPAMLDDLLGADVQAELLAGLGHPPELPLTMSTPLIAAINGTAAGLGMVHALYADLRFVAQTAAFSSVFARLGLIAEHGSAWLLPRLVGVPNALDILMSGRRIDAAEAMRMGLAQRVLPAAELLDAATDYARVLASACSPRSLGVIKEQVWGGLAQSAADAVADSVRLMGESFQADDFAEAKAAQRERRRPDFGQPRQRAS
jgi:enoyl-CoA hydratase/carnithine racemase